MNTVNSRSILRWVMISLFGGLGLWFGGSCIATMYAQVTTQRDWWVKLGTVTFWLYIMLPISGVPLLVAYCIYKRQYKRLCMLCGCVAALFTFYTLFTIPERLGWYRPKPFDVNQINPLWDLISGLLFLGYFVFSYKAVQWVYRRVYKTLWAKVAPQIHPASAVAV